MVAALILGLGSSVCVDGGHDVRANWFVREPPDPAATTLRITVEAGGSCDSLQRLDVTETSSEVVIIAVGRHENGDRFCTLENQLLPQLVELESPLGERVLRGCSVLGGPLIPGSMNAPIGDADCASVPQ